MRSTRVSHPKTGLCSSSLTGRALRRLRVDCDPPGPGIKLKAEITRKQSRKADNHRAGARGGRVLRVRGRRLGVGGDVGGGLDRPITFGPGQRRLVRLRGVGLRLGAAVGLLGSK